MLSSTWKVCSASDVLCFAQLLQWNWQALKMFLYTKSSELWPGQITKPQTHDKHMLANKSLLCVQNVEPWIHDKQMLSNICCPTSVGQHLRYTRQHFVGQQYGGDGGISRRRRHYCIYLHHINHQFFHRLGLPESPLLLKIWNITNK